VVLIYIFFHKKTHHSNNAYYIWEDKNIFRNNETFLNLLRLRSDLKIDFGILA